jgi:transposase
MDRDRFRRAEARFDLHLPINTRGRDRVDDRRLISGIVHVLKSGSHSREIMQATLADASSAAARGAGTVTRSASNARPPATPLPAVSARR